MDGFAAELEELGSIGQQGGEEGDVGLGVDDAELGGTAHDNVVLGLSLGIFAIGYGAELVDVEGSVVVRLDAGGGTDVATGDAADVEGTQC